MPRKTKALFFKEALSLLEYFTFDVVGREHVDKLDCKYLSLIVVPVEQDNTPSEPCIAICQKHDVNSSGMHFLRMIEFLDSSFPLQTMHIHVQHVLELINRQLQFPYHQTVGRLFLVLLVDNGLADAH